MSQPRALLLSPHNDDETLFAALTILKHRAHVLVCLRSAVQRARGGPSADIRETETAAAMGILGTTWEQLPIMDDAPDWEALAAILHTYADDDTYGMVFAPAIYTNGHEHHNEVARVAGEVFGDRVVSYHTYERGELRKRGREVACVPALYALKLRAMACYRSQIMLESTRPWFIDDCLREWLA